MRRRFSVVAPLVFALSLVFTAGCGGGDGDDVDAGAGSIDANPNAADASNGGPDAMTNAANALGQPCTPDGAGGRPGRLPGRSHLPSAQRRQRAVLHQDLHRAKRSGMHHRLHGTRRAGLRVRHRHQQRHDGRLQRVRDHLRGPGRRHLPDLPGDLPGAAAVHGRSHGRRPAHDPRQSLPVADPRSVRTGAIGP